MQLKKQRTRQAVDVTARKKKNKRAPARIAPITLVATNWIASKTMERSTVPKIPVSSAVIMEHNPSQHSFPKIAPAKRITARYTTAIPSNTHKKAGVRVMVAVILKNAVIMPMTRLANTAKTVRLVLQHPQDVDIKFHLPHYTIQGK